MDLLIVIVALGLGISIGMYIASQISEHVARRGQDRDLMRNMKELEKKKYGKSN